MKKRKKVQGNDGVSPPAEGPASSELADARSSQATDQALQPPDAPPHEAEEDAFDRAFSQTLEERIYHLRLEFDLLRAWYAPKEGTGQWSRTEIALQRTEEAARNKPQLKP